MTPLRSLIEKQLGTLSGMRLMAVTRAADMATFYFQRPGLEPGGYSLHVQCPWRLEGPSGVITGRGDLWKPANPGDPAWLQAPSDYDQWRSLQEARLDEFHARTEGNAGVLKFESITADEVGGFALAMSGGYRILVFPATSRGECWRFFRPRSEEDHFVVPPEDEPSV